MSSRVDGIRLAIAFIRHRGAQATVLLLMGGVLSGCVLGVATAQRSAQGAILDSLRADLGQKAYALQTGDPRAVAILQGIQHALPVQDAQGDVSVGNGEFSAPVLIRRTTDTSLELGVLTDGTRPRRAGDVVLSQATAQALDIGLADDIRVTVDGTVSDGRVVGLSVDPADAANKTLIQLVNRSSEFVASRWLSDNDFYSEPSLRPFLDRRTATYQSTDSLLQSAELNRPQFLSAMRFLPAGFGLLLAVVLISVVAVMSQRWSVYADALISAGMSQAVAWRRMFSIVFRVVLIGEFVGATITLTALYVFRTGVSAWFGQRWVVIAVPAKEPLLIVGLTLVSAALAVTVVRWAPSWTSWIAGRRSERRWAMPVAVATTGFSFFIWILLIRTSSQPGRGGSARLALVFAAVVVASLPFVLAPLSSWGLPPATRAILRHLLSGLRPVAAVGAVVALTCAMWTAQTTRDANVGETLSSPLQPAGSFVISEMPNSVIPALDRLYHSKGGSRIISYGIPDETTANLRVTSTRLIECMAERKITNPNEVPPTCFPQEAASPINTVMIGAAGSPSQADPRLLRDGKVGLMLFDAGKPSTSRLADTDAEPNATLGGNLPGLVVPPDSSVLSGFGLAPSGRSTVLLSDFDTLTPAGQFYIRAATFRLAPAAQTADGTDPTAYDRLRSTANTVSILGAVAAVVILLLGGLSMVVAHSLVRRTLVDLGAAAGPRWRLVARLTVVPTTTAALTVPLAILTASFGGQSRGASYGSLWLLPGVFAMVASIAIGTGFLRTPQLTDS